MGIPKQLTWNDRLALIENFKPNDATILRVFGVTKNELIVARNLKQNGTFIPSKNLDFNSYATAFSSTQSIHKPIMTNNTPIQSIMKPETSTKKRGRKGNNIVLAFNSIPSTPTNAVQFAKQHSVSIAVLRQNKRFDSIPGTGMVNVRKDKESGELMIWRTKS